MRISEEHPEIKHIHLIVRGKAAQQEDARKFYGKIGAYAITQTPRAEWKHEPEKNEENYEYRTTTVEAVKEHYITTSVNHPGTPIHILKWGPNKATIASIQRRYGSKTELITEMKHNQRKENGGSGIHLGELIRNSDLIYLVTTVDTDTNENHTQLNRSHKTQHTREGTSRPGGNAPISTQERENGERRRTRSSSYPQGAQDSCSQSQPHPEVNRYKPTTTNRGYEERDTEESEGVDDLRRTK